MSEREEMLALAGQLADKLDQMPFGSPNTLLRRVERTLRSAATPAPGYAQGLWTVADAIDLARYQHPQNPRERPRPFNEACPSDQEYAIRLARAAIAALPAPAGVEDWQPIETAPKDMTEIIVLCGRKDVRLGWYFAPSPTTFGWRDQHNAPIKPNHWKPLGAPPTILAKPAQEGQGS